MARKTVLELMGGVSLHVNGAVSTPTEGSDEYTSFLQALDQAQTDAADVDYDWKGLRYTHRTTLGASGTSVGLPDEFIKPMGFPKIEGKEFPEVAEHETGLFLSSDKYVVFNKAERYMSVNPALASVSQIDIPYLSRPSSLATSNQFSFVPSDQYLIHRASYYILLGRENPRYAEYLSESNMLLARMIGREVNEFVQKDTSIKNELEEKHGFELGTD